MTFRRRLLLSCCRYLKGPPDALGVGWVMGDWPLQAGARLGPAQGAKADKLLVETRLRLLLLFLPPKKGGAVAVGSRVRARGPCGCMTMPEGIYNSGARLVVMLGEYLGSSCIVLSSRPPPLGGVLP